MDEIKKIEDWKKANPGQATCKGKGCLGHAILNGLCSQCYLKKKKEVKP